MKIRQLMIFPRNSLTAVLLFFCIIVHGYSLDQPPTFEWEGSLKTQSDFYDYGEGLIVSMKDSLSFDLLLVHDLFGGEITYTLGTELFYAPQEDSSKKLSDAFIPFPDNLAVSWEYIPEFISEPWIKTSLGRIEAKEPSGLLLRNRNALHPNQLIDGLDFEFRSNRFYIATEMGYLGLLDKRINRILLTQNDENESSNLNRYFAPRRSLVIIRTEAANLLIGQNFALFGIWQKDFRKDGPQFDSWYIGTKAAGELPYNLHYDTDFILSISVPSDSDTGAGILSSFNLVYGLPWRLFHETWFSLLWASGEGNHLKAFPALAGPDISPFFREPLSNVVKLSLGMDFNIPVPPKGAGLNPALELNMLFLPQGNESDEYLTLTAEPYLGTEILLSLEYLPIEGLSIGIQSGALFGTDNIVPGLQLEAKAEL